jgi:hypothetical protein
MTCEEFAIAGLELDAGESDSLLQKAGREHLRECPHCAALHGNWLTLREDLRALGNETAEAHAPSRVEMRLRQEFRTRHITVKTRRRAFILGWSLAAAATLLFAITWANWRMQKDTNLATNHSSSIRVPDIQKTAGQSTTPAEASTSGNNNVLLASNSSDDFTFLPDSMPPAPEDATVVHVRMQRAALGALGLTVNEEHAGDWINVDLLVGDDGLPQAVRLPQTSSN